MTALKLKGPIFLFTALTLLLIGNMVSAGTMAIGNDRLNFILGDESGLFEMMTGPVQEVAVPFSFYFDDEPGYTDPLPTGEVTKITIRFNFDPASLFYTGTIVETSWQINNLTAHDPANGIIAVELFGASGIPIPIEPISYVAFKFEAYCQPELTVNNLTFEQNGDYNYVETYNNGTTPWSPGTYDDGTVTIADYQANFGVETKVALLGDDMVRVEILGTHNFNLTGFNHYFTFDSDNLIFAGYEMNEDIFPPAYGCTPGWCTPSSNGNTIHFQFLFDSPWTYFTPPNETEVWYYAFYFNLIPGQADNSFNYVDFDDVNSTVYPFYFCEDLWNVATYTNGGIQIPHYTIDLKSQPHTGYIVKDETATFDILMKNNFPAGDYSDQNSNGAISIVYDWPDIFNYPVVAGDDQIDPLTFEGGSHTNGDRTYFTYQVYDANRTVNYMPPTEEYVHLLTLNFNMDATYIPEYEQRTVAIDFKDNFIYLPYYDWHTQAEDTTGYGIAEAELDEVDYETVPAEIKMGRFYSPFSYDNDNTIDQPLYIAANFDIGQFSVTVNLLQDDDCKITGVVAELPGVSYTYGLKTATIYYNGTGTFLEATGDNNVKIATVKYRTYCDGVNKVAEQTPPGEPTYYYEYGHVSFTNASIYDDASPAHSHYVDVDPANVRGKCFFVNVFADSDPDNPYDYKSTWDNTPAKFNLYPNSPNPFNPQTAICYDIPEATHVTLDIINILGQKVATLVDEIQAPGH
ncbi:MAG: hypothetical protein AB1746_16095, partial [Candidatus Zixiibacteriota bacterium]